MAALVGVRLELRFFENIRIQAEPERVDAATGLHVVQDARVDEFCIFRVAVALLDDLSNSVSHASRASAD